MGKIKVDYDKLSDCCINMSSEYKLIFEQLNNVTNIKNSVNDAWESNSSIKFLNDFSDVTVNFIEIYNRLNGSTNFLNNVLENSKARENSVMDMLFNFFGK